VEPVLETSTDLATWTAEGVAVENAADLGIAWRKRALVPLGDRGQRYVRLKLRWAAGP
jgi:hypothetical protein